MMSVNRCGENNPNWKGGVSAKRYHYVKKYRVNHPLKNKARSIVNAAVRSGRLLKPSYCCECGNTFNSKDITAHHDDYSEPLNIRWMCRWCHAKLHKGEPRG